MTGLRWTAGELIELRNEIGLLGDLLEGASAPWPEPAAGAGPTLRIAIEAETAGFEVGSSELVARGAWRGDGSGVIRNVVGSGFDLRLELDGEAPRFRFRWRPPLAQRLAAVALRARFRLLARAVLVQYPALWRAGLRGRYPLHAPACSAGGATFLLAGPGGLGKSTLLAGELARGAVVGSDNLSVSDGIAVWGVIEPMRLSGGSGPRMPHGRREASVLYPAAELRPDRVVVPRRVDHQRALLQPCEPGRATQALVAGTYAAGELRRYWSFDALLALATGRGPAHPGVSEVAAALAGRLPCFELLMPGRPGPWLTEVLAPEEAIA